MVFTMLIEEKAGAILLLGHEGLINKNLVFLSFAKSELYKTSVVSEINSYMHCFIQDQKIYDSFDNLYRVNISLIFSPNGLIDMVSLTLKFDDSDLQWRTWSKEKEFQRDAMHKKILEEQLGKPPYGYPWGIIGAEYDARTGGSSIGVRYFHSEKERRKWKWNGSQWRYRQIPFLLNALNGLTQEHKPLYLLLVVAAGRQPGKARLTKNLAILQRDGIPSAVNIVPPSSLWSKQGVHCDYGA
jgi:hypothetical protein